MNARNQGKNYKPIANARSDGEIVQWADLTYWVFWKIAAPRSAAWLSESDNVILLETRGGGKGALAGAGQDHRFDLVIRLELHQRVVDFLLKQEASALSLSGRFSVIRATPSGRSLRMYSPSPSLSPSRSRTREQLHRFARCLLFCYPVPRVASRTGQRALVKCLAERYAAAISIGRTHR